MYSILHGVELAYLVNASHRITDVVLLYSVYERPGIREAFGTFQKHPLSSYSPNNFGRQVAVIWALDTVHQMLISHVGAFPSGRLSLPKH